MERNRAVSSVLGVIQPRNYGQVISRIVCYTIIQAGVTLTMRSIAFLVVTTLASCHAIAATATNASNPMFHDGRYIRCTDHLSESTRHVGGDNVAACCPHNQTLMSTLRQDRLWCSGGQYISNSTISCLNDANVCGELVFGCCLQKLDGSWCGVGKAC